MFKLKFVRYMGIILMLIRSISCLTLTNMYMLVRIKSDKDMNNIIYKNEKLQNQLKSKSCTAIKKRECDQILYVRTYVHAN